MLWLWLSPEVLLLLVLEQKWVGFCFNQQVSRCVIGIVTERLVKVSFYVPSWVLGLNIFVDYLNIAEVKPAVNGAVSRRAC